MKGERTYDMPEHLRDLKFCEAVVLKVLPSRRAAARSGRLFSLK